MPSVVSLTSKVSKMLLSASLTVNEVRIFPSGTVTLIVNVSTQGYNPVNLPLDETTLSSHPSTDNSSYYKSTLLLSTILYNDTNPYDELVRLAWES